MTDSMWAAVSTDSGDAELIEALLVERGGRARRVRDVEDAVADVGGLLEDLLEPRDALDHRAADVPGAEVLMDAHHVRVVRHDGDVMGVPELDDRQPFGDAGQ